MDSHHFQQAFPYDHPIWKPHGPGIYEDPHGYASQYMTPPAETHPVVRYLQEHARRGHHANRQFRQYHINDYVITLPVRQASTIHP